MVSRRRLLQLIAGSALSGIATAAYGAGIGARELRVTRYDLRPPQWTPGLSVKIAAVADLHACDPWMDLDRIAGIVDRTNTLGADLIVLLGDYLTAMPRLARKIPPSAWASVLAGLKAPLGVHAILGNHDWWDDQAVQRSGHGMPEAGRALEAAGIPVYENDAVRLVKSGHPFWLVGLGDQIAYVPARRFGWRTSRAGVDDLTATLAKVTDDAPVVLMAHEPDIAMQVPERVSLMLAGHMHAGQVRLFGWAPVTPSRYGSRFLYGYRREKCDVIVSGGLGCTNLPVRIGAPPEIVLVTLGAAEAVVAGDANNRV
ncbi:metallophosphoesterase [Bradyrhizobium sp. LHD-71]|uniref:metallophosphoesterase n=1 Tax=Bradyrhizobium sp. LHD-71 TaxID=3072141 RepID=UPI00280E1CF7|nr:metallophosphoesterase [Bradyrhizobium sp. LHD-71]MDQ8726746.1 metallophosphoesterase [Bradyrhizobium sp. LHD-71]